jgi:putative glutamine amidotransferase
MPHHARPFIGINADFIAGGKQGGAHARLHAGYFDTVLASGGLPLIFPPLAEQAQWDALLDRVDGVILGGGLDLDPRRQGLTMHPAVQPLAARREDSDQLLLSRIIKRRLPLLAIGLGMQQLNIFFGGTLFQHLPEEMPRALPHRDPTGAAHRHAVLLEPGTRLEEIYGGGEIRVNSAHHQAVRQLGASLRVGAHAPDGVIEAIETTDPNWCCIGVQWHPESETASALDTQLFECFLQACLRQGQNLELAA